MKYRHIFFDLDHTLWDFDNNARLSLTILHEQMGLEARGVTPFETFYERYLHHNNILWNRYHKGYITSEDLKWKRMWRTLIEFKIGEEALARQMSDLFLEILPEQKGVFPYTFEILDYLAAKNYRLHLITNGFEKTQWRKLKSSGMDKYFDKVITSEGSNSVKPNIEIFEYALAQTGATVEESIMIGDNIVADIMGAITAGWDNIFVNHVLTDEFVPATHIITHLKELEGIL
jgi:putative hydrolase of the HAD superfamily